MFPLFACSDDLEWGHLTGRFVYKGDPPPVKMHLADKDKAALGDRIPDESLIVNKKNRGIENIIVYLSQKKSDELNVHPSYARSAKSKVEFAMQNGRFVPHVLLLRTSQTMLQRNKDKVGHHAQILLANNTPS